MGSINPLIRPEIPSGNIYKPGLHTHNTGRRQLAPPRSDSLRYVQVGLLILGCLSLGYYLYSLSNEYVYQAYQNWAFDQQIAGRTSVSFTDFVRERTPFAFLAGGKPNDKAAVSGEGTTTGKPAVPNGIPGMALPTGALVGRVSIDRLNLSAVVREGVDAGTLSKAVGHVPKTALPGNPGNFAIAAHRDTLFRGLKDIQSGDLVKFESPTQTFTYKVLATKIVKPSDVSVLRADGGGLIPPTVIAGKDQLLTMITCYPFYFVGSAPKRFIVEGKLVSSEAQSSAAPVAARAESAGKWPSPSPKATFKHSLRPPVRLKLIRQATFREPGHVAGSARSRSEVAAAHIAEKHGSDNHLKKRGFWHRLF